jgi:hypothetical protein
VGSLEGQARLRPSAGIAVASEPGHPCPAVRCRGLRGRQSGNEREYGE